MVCLCIGIASAQNYSDKVIVILEKAKSGKQVKDLKMLLSDSGIELPQVFSYVPDINPINPVNDISISSLFSPKRLHPIYKEYKAHNGIDIVAKLHTPIYTSASGVVETSKFYNGSAGHSVIINHKYGFQTKYFHLAFFIVKKGEKVKKGDLIGYLGDSGGVTGPHLHYEILKNENHLDPKEFL